MIDFLHIFPAYLNQCTAEAQEVTIARAIELKHNASLISSLGKKYDFEIIIIEYYK